MFRKTIGVPSSGMKTSDLLHEIQELSGDAVAQVHANGPEIAPLGLMWVVVRYDLRLSRALCPGEEIYMTTWANPVRHAMSQRNYRFSDAEGKILLEGAGIWAIADRETRALADPKERGVFFETEITGEEGPRPQAPVKLPLTEVFCYTVTGEVLDINGHMNNTRYFDLAEKVVSEENRTSLRRLQVIYEREARPGEKLEIHWGRNGTRYFLAGDGPRGSCFRMALDYTKDDTNHV